MQRISCSLVISSHKYKLYHHIVEENFKNISDDDSCMTIIRKLLSIHYFAVSINLLYKFCKQFMESNPK